MNSLMGLSSRKNAPTKKYGRPKKREGRINRRRNDIPPQRVSKRSISPVPPAVPVLTRYQQTCLSKNLPTRLHYLRCRRASSNPISYRAKLFKKDKDNLCCQQLWVLANWRSLAYHQRLGFILELLKDEYFVDPAVTSATKSPAALSSRKSRQPNPDPSQSRSTAICITPPQLISTW